MKHRVSSPYHPKTRRKVDVSNREIKSILMKTMNTNKNDSIRNIDDALWSYRTAYKTPIGSFLYHLVYESHSTCRLNLIIENYGS